MAVVLDTNVLVSAAFFTGSRPALALRHAAASSLLLASHVTLSELAVTLEKAKFDRYASRIARREFVAFIYTMARVVPIHRRVQACRDPDDDKFLDVAVNGGADLVVTGDDDLLALDPFEGIRIVTPTAYLARSTG